MSKMASHKEGADFFLSAQKAYNLVASSYDKSFQSRTALVEDEVIYGFLKRFLSHSSILDLGCGTGAFPEHVSVSMFDYIGLAEFCYRYCADPCDFVLLPENQ